MTRSIMLTRPKLEDGEMSAKDVREMIGFAGVTLSLVFVGLEVRQNTVVARAQTRQSLTELYAQHSLTMATDADLRREWSRTFYDDSTRVPAVGAEWAMWANLRQLENVYLQNQDGVVDESVFYSYAWRQNPLAGEAKFRAWWADRRERFNPDFVAEFERENRIRAP